MLKGIDALLTPPMLAALAEMGHGDELAIVDANFPATTNARLLIHAGGLASPAVARAVLSLLPLDQFVSAPASVMTPPEGRPPIIGEFQAALDAAAGHAVTIEDLDRFVFYRRAAESFAIILTGETRRWGNLLLRKGVINL